MAWKSALSSDFIDLATSSAVTAEGIDLARRRQLAQIDEAPVAADACAVNVTIEPDDELAVAVLAQVSSFATIAHLALAAHVGKPALRFVM